MSTNSGAGTSAADATDVAFTVDHDDGSANVDTERSKYSFAEPTRNCTEQRIECLSLPGICFFKRFSQLADFFRLFCYGLRHRIDRLIRIGSMRGFQRNFLAGKRFGMRVEPDIVALGGANKRVGLLDLDDAYRLVTNFGNAPTELYVAGDFLQRT